MHSCTNSFSCAPRHGSFGLARTQLRRARVWTGPGANVERPRDAVPRGTAGTPVRAAGGFSHWELARGRSRAEVALCPGTGPHAPAVSSRAPAVPGAVPRVLSLCPAWGQSVSCDGAAAKGVWLCCAAGTASPSPLTCHGSGTGDGKERLRAGFGGTAGMGASRLGSASSGNATHRFACLQVPCLSLSRAPA